MLELTVLPHLRRDLRRAPASRVGTS